MVLINISNIISIIKSPYDFFAKIKIITIIVAGGLSAISTIDTIMIVIVSMLFGINLVMVMVKVKFLKKRNNVKITLGAGIISIAAAGCASCGLSLVSIVGLGAAVAALPLKGLELYIVTIAILLLSLYYNLSSLYRVCKI